MPAFVMPRLSDTMEEGTIIEWTVADGSVVAKGEEIVEIEGDKATMSVAADADGALKILRRAGETVEVRATIAWIGDDAPAAGVEDDEEAPPTQAPAPAETPRESRGGGISPLARRAAREEEVDLDCVVGTGPGGRILVADVRAAAAGAKPCDRPPADSGGGAGERIELTPTQGLIARRMTESKATVPDFQAWIEIDMEPAVDVRKAAQAEGHEVSLNDVVVWAVARTLRRFPRLNASYRDGGLDLHEGVAVGIAVAAAESLVVPVIADADRMQLHEIAAESRRLSELGRSGRLTPAEMAGATFTVSNLGMLGVGGFVAIVSPPQVAILAVGAVEPRVVPVDGAIGIRRRLTATLSIDHRAVYGAEAARFLASLRELLESAAEPAGR